MFQFAVDWEENYPLPAVVSFVQGTLNLKLSGGFLREEKDIYKQKTTQGQFYSSICKSRSSV